MDSPADSKKSQNRLKTIVITYKGYYYKFKTYSASLYIIYIIYKMCVPISTPHLKTLTVFASLKEKRPPNLEGYNILIII